jgi:nucleotide-binding universal stress UspA family protein
MDNGNGSGPILLAYDGSEYAQASIQEAARQLSPGRDAVVFTVWTPLAALPFGAPAAGGVDIDQGLEAEARKVADEGARLAADAGFEATALTASGSPVWQMIVDEAEAQDAGVVVMGSHGRTGLGLLLMGSVAAAVSRHTERPVLIVHAGNHAPDVSGS